MNDIHNLDFNLLKLLDVVLRHQHIGQAAVELNLTQSAVSHGLRKLRDFFHDPLLVRLGNTMQPTEKARQLAPKVARIIKSIQQELLQPGILDASRCQRAFTLRTCDHFDGVYLNCLVQQFRIAAPGCQLHVRPFTEDRLQYTLESGAADVAIDVNRSNFTQLKAQKLADMGFISAVCNSHPLAGKKTITLDYFVSFQHCLISTTGTGPGAVDLALQELGYSRQIALRVGPFMTAPQAIINTPYILTGHRAFLLAQQRYLPLHCFEPPLNLPGFPLSLFWHVKDDKDPANQWLRQLVKSVVCTSGL